jgi:hypothetical protein
MARRYPCPDEIFRRRMTSSCSTVSMPSATTAEWESAAISWIA